MKKRSAIVTGFLGFALVALAAGFALTANASMNRSLDRGMMRGGNGGEKNLENQDWYNNLSTEQRTVLDSIRSDQEEAMTARQKAMTDAISNGNYEAWVTVVKDQMGENAPILSQVTAANFSQFVEGHKLMQQAQEKFAAIGIDMPGMGMGKGMMHFGFDRNVMNK